MVSRTRARSRNDRDADQPPMRALEAAEFAPKYILAVIDRQPTQITAVEPTDEGGWIVEAKSSKTSGSRRRRTYSRCTKSNSTPAEICWRIGELVVTCAARGGHRRGSSVRSRPYAETRTAMGHSDTRDNGVDIPVSRQLPSNKRCRIARSESIGS